MEKKGIEIHLNTRAQSIHDTSDGVTLTYSDVSDRTPYFVDGDAILIATGRKPMIEGLNLQAAGVKVDAHGAIVVKRSVAHHRSSRMGNGRRKRRTTIYLFFTR